MQGLGGRSTLCTYIRLTDIGSPSPHQPDPLAGTPSSADDPSSLCGSSRCIAGRLSSADVGGRNEFLRSWDPRNVLEISESMRQRDTSGSSRSGMAVASQTMTSAHVAARPSCCSNKLTASSRPNSDTLNGLQNLLLGNSLCLQPRPTHSSPVNQATDVVQVFPTRGRSIPVCSARARETTGVTLGTNRDSSDRLSSMARIASNPDRFDFRGVTPGPASTRPTASTLVNTAVVPRPTFIPPATGVPTGNCEPADECLRKKTTITLDQFNPQRVLALQVKLNLHGYLNNTKLTAAKPRCLACTEPGTRPGVTPQPPETSLLDGKGCAQSTTRARRRLQLKEDALTTKWNGNQVSPEVKLCPQSIWRQLRYHHSHQKVPL